MTRGRQTARAGKPDRYGLVPWNDWLDADPGYNTFRSPVTEALWELFRQIPQSASHDVRNIKAARMVRASNGKSHYYIDGTVNESGRIPILVYDEKSGEYWEAC